MTANEIAALFEEIVGWPYKSPGTYDENGIDCSGAFVRAYRKHGLSVYHGSNRIIRKYCRDAREIVSENELRVGMAVFKARASVDRLSPDYQKGGRYYDPALPYDYYHIGLVTSQSPLRIVHATTPCAKADDTLGKWTWRACLTDVDYGETEDGLSELEALLERALMLVREAGA